MKESTDAELVAHALDGRSEAFGTLVERYQDELVSYARYMGFDDATAHDLVQDGFIRGFRHLRRCGDPERFDGWIFKIVSNLCRTAGRRRSKRSMEPLEAHGATLVSEKPGPHERAEASVVRERVEAALDRIAPDQREALVLLYLQGHSVREIAEMTDASLSAIKMRLKRGREALKDALGPDFGQEDR